MNARWYFDRLKRASFLEYFYRLNQLWRKKIDRYFQGFHQQEDQTSSRFLVAAQGLPMTAFDNCPSLDKRLIVEKANSILDHQFEIFGRRYDFGHPINWHLDPKTGNSWPLKFWGDMDYRDGIPGSGARYVWELNRLHHFPQLAIAFKISGKAEYKDEIFAQLRSWIASNPYPRGINWAMGIELGIRIVNVVYTLKFLGDEPLDLKQKNLIARFISLHGRHLYRYPSKYSSCANHAVAEALGLFVAGLCFPGLRNADQWKRYGKTLLEREVLRQIYPDGSSFEHSIPYLQFVLDHFLVFYLLGKEYGEIQSGALEKRLKAAFLFISRILDGKGNYPAIGDGDDSFLLKLWFGEHNNFVSLLNTGAILFDCPDWMIESPKLDQKTFFLLGEEATTKWKKLKAEKKSVTFESRYFKDAGLAVIRDRSYPDLLFVGNSGPLGLKPLSGHGHADALSFWLSIDGKPMLVDPGTYVYQGEGRWRKYFRSSSAHNTVKVDRADQAEISGDFMFRNDYRIKDPRLAERENTANWSAGHDAYSKLQDPVFHIREVAYLRQVKAFVIRDIFDCRKEHLLECFFHFHPSISIWQKNGMFWAGADAVEVKIQIDQKWQVVNLVKGGKKPLLGWYSPSFDWLQESWSMRLSATIDKSDVYQTEICLI